jgi:hypothetical protein
LIQYFFRLAKAIFNNSMSIDRFDYGYESQLHLFI